MSVCFYDSDESESGLSDVSGERHHLSIVANAGRVKISVTPNRDKNSAIHLVLSDDQLREVAIGLFHAAEFLGTVKVSDLGTTT